MRILVADDDADNRAIALLILESAGHQVVLASHGLEAVETALKELPDVVLLDLTMPKLTGWEVAQRLREDARTSGVPIIAFTAHALAGAELKAKAAGCNDYIAKPCMPRDILRKVEEWGKAVRP